MTQQEANDKARGRWGSRAYAVSNSNGDYFVSDGYASWEREVYGLPERWGSGKSFEEAFADADRKEKANG